MVSTVLCGSRRFSAVADVSVMLSEPLKGSPPRFIGLGALRFRQGSTHLGALRFAEVL